MKRLLIAALFAVFAAGAFAFDLNLEARSDFLYTSFMENSAYNAIAASETVTALSTYEKIRLKLKDTVDQVKFDFDARAYLYPQTETLSYTIDSAYFSFENGPFVVYAGKQRMKWGTAYFFNPTDRLQPAVNVFRPTEDLEGIYAVRGEMTSDICTPLIVIMPRTNGYSQDPARDFNAAARIYKLVGTCDIYLDYIYNPDGDSAGAAASWDTGFFVVNLEAALDANPPAGCETIDIGGRRYSSAATIGVTKLISNEASIFAEYFRNTAGLSSEGYSDTVTAMGFGMPLSKKDYLAYSLSYTWDNSIQLSLTGLHGLDDGTTYAFPSIAWVENQNYDIQLSLLQNLTQKGTREGTDSTPFYSETELRINAYF
jgi:hypothetical protein